MQYVHGQLGLLILLFSTSKKTKKKKKKKKKIKESRKTYLFDLSGRDRAELTLDQIFLTSRIRPKVHDPAERIDSV